MRVEKHIVVTPLTHKNAKLQATMRDMPLNEYIAMLIQQDKITINKKLKG